MGYIPQIQRNPFDVSWVRTGCPVNAQRQKGTPHWCHDRPQPGAWQPPVWSDLLKKRDRSNIFKNWISMDPQNISKHDGIELHIKRSNSWAL